MPEILTAPALTALGFLLGSFYTRTMKLAERLPERYISKEDCLQIRNGCQHVRDLGREEVLQRLDRMETKMDSLAEKLLEDRLI